MSKWIQKTNVQLRHLYCYGIHGDHGTDNGTQGKDHGQRHAEDAEKFCHHLQPLKTPLPCVLCYNHTVMPTFNNVMQLSIG
jgi:hypothetical protein